MTKTNVAKRDEPITTVAPANQPGMPTFLADQPMTGAGVPTNSDEFLIPMARVLDPKSPECMRGNPAQVPGAEPGDIFIKNAPAPLIKADKGLLFQPCFRESAVIEWRPRSAGGGFVARHPDGFLNDPKVEMRPHPERPDKMVPFNKVTGGMLVDTRYVAGFAIDESGANAPMPLVLPFSSTGHTVAKQWNMLMAMKKANGHPVDIFAIYYRIKTRLRQRQDQAWYVFDVADAGEGNPPATLWVPTIEDYNRGKELFEQLSKGQKSFDMTQHDDATATAATSDTM